MKYSFFFLVILGTLSVVSALTLGSASTDYVRQASVNQCSENIHNLDFVKCGTSVFKTPMDAHKQLSCLGVVKSEPTCDSAECEAYAPRSEVIGIATRIRNIPMKKDFICENIFHDVTKITFPSWTCQIIERASQSGLISTSDIDARPTQPATRGEALTILMRSICVNPGAESVTNIYDFTSTQLWSKKIFQSATSRGIIDVSETNFQPDEVIQMQELYTLSARVTEWARNNPTCPPYVPENTCVIE